MEKYNKNVVGMDVHKETIVIALIVGRLERVTETYSIENQPKSIEKMVHRMVEKGSTEFVFEAGPCGYEVQRQITRMGHPCAVIAPGLIPVRPGDRVKTDRRDAEKLARLWRAGELTEIRIPSREEEAARDLVRVREDGITDRLRARNRLGKFLLRLGRVYRETKSWGVSHRVWLRAQKFEWAAQEQTFEMYVRTMEESETRLALLDQQILDLAQKERYRIPVEYLRCFKGIDTLSAITLLVEAQDLRRFESAPAFMKYTGLVSSEYSSGASIRRGGITKTGNAHLRRVLVESSWSYRRANVLSAALAKRRKGCPTEVIQVAQKAQDRLQRIFKKMHYRNKPIGVIVVAVARELSGFVWSMARHFPTVKTVEA